MRVRANGAALMCGCFTCDSPLHESHVDLPLIDTRSFYQWGVVFCEGASAMSEYGELLRLELAYRRFLSCFAAHVFLRTGLSGFTPNRVCPDLWGPMGTYGDLWGPVGTYGDLSGPMGTCGDVWGPMGTYGDL